jgi:hypothetical protein
VKSLAGEMTWDLPADASNEQIVSYACSKLYGMRSTLRRRADVARRDDAPDERPDEGPDPGEQIEEHEVVAAALRAFEHDAEGLIYVRRTLAGDTRAEIVAALGPGSQDVQFVRRRVIRRLAALRAKMNTEREDGPPSSGPRGSYHALQTPEERQGATPQPDRRAGRARGRG